MKFLSVAGHGRNVSRRRGILAHGFRWLEHWIKGISTRREGGYTVDAVIAVMSPVLTNLVVGIVAGALALAVVIVVRKAWPRKSA